MFKLPSLFDDEENKGEIKPISKPELTSLARKPLVRRDTSKPIFKEPAFKKIDIPDDLRDFADELMSVTKNRLFEEGCEDLEAQWITEHLRKGVEKSGREVKMIINQAKSLLEVMPNLCTTQAIDKVCDGDSVKLLNAYRK